jgi:hypothetical protein
MNSMRASISCGFLVLATAASAPSARAQDININCGPPPTPSAQYGAASGQVGYWNSVPWSPNTLQLLDLAGQPTNAWTVNSNTCDNDSCAGGCGVCPGFSGSQDDQAFLGSWMNADCFDVHSVQIWGLEPGRYAAYLYTYGCAAIPYAGVDMYVNNHIWYSFSSPGVIWQGSWTGFPVGRCAFEATAGGYLNFVPSGAYETGFAGIQLVKLDPTGQVSCLGDGTGAACPCGNFGLPGHGCRNSHALRGAELGASGTASLSFDTLGLNCGYEPPGAASIVLQGNQVIGPVVFGDGLRCAGGSLKRLFFVNASAAGSLSEPPNSYTSVSSRSAALGDVLQPGDLRVYQVYYRDPDPNFCPSPQGSTFNVSNAVEIVWGS